MKVIKEAPQKEWSKEYTCTGKGNDDDGCESVLLVNKSDLFRTERHSYGDTLPTYFATFECPVCGVLTDVEDAPVKANTLPKQNAVNDSL